MLALDLFGRGFILVDGDGCRTLRCHACLEGDDPSWVEAIRRYYKPSTTPVRKRHPQTWFRFFDHSEGFDVQTLPSSPSHHGGLPCPHWLTRCESLDMPGVTDLVPKGEPGTEWELESPSASQSASPAAASTRSCLGRGILPWPRWRIFPHSCGQVAPCLSHDSRDALGDAGIDDRPFGNDGL